VLCPRGGDHLPHPKSVSAEGNGGKRTGKYDGTSREEGSWTKHNFLGSISMKNFRGGGGRTPTKQKRKPRYGFATDTLRYIA